MARLDVERLGSGPPVVFVHGSVVGADRTWRRQRELADRWLLLFANRPGFGSSPPLERGDFEAEAPLIAELLDDGAHLVGHSYGAVIALLAAAHRPEAVRSLTVSEPGSLGLARGNPAVDRMIEDGSRLYSHAEEIPTQIFLSMFREGANSANETPEQLPEWLERGAELLMKERPPFDAEVPMERLREGGFPILVISGGHSEAFEAVCDTLAAEVGAQRAVIPGRGHTVPSTGAPYNRRLRSFLAEAEVPST
jgi:pimeloyl-ACP methyl ester carboxylesterase